MYTYKQVHKILFYDAFRAYVSTAQHTIVAILKVFVNIDCLMMNTWLRRCCVYFCKYQKLVKLTDKSLQIHVVPNQQEYCSCLTRIVIFKMFDRLSRLEPNVCFFHHISLDDGMTLGFGVGFRRMFIDQKAFSMSQKVVKLCEGTLRKKWCAPQGIKIYTSDHDFKCF